MPETTPSGRPNTDGDTGLGERRPKLSADEVIRKLTGRTIVVYGGRSARPPATRGPAPRSAIRNR